MAERQATLGELGLTSPSGTVDRIHGLAVDSRAVKQGFLFAALPGSQIHGATFAATAVAKGATVVLTDAEGAKLVQAEGLPVALVVVEDAREAFARAAALWFAAQPEVMVAVTGTNGKTSVATFIRQIWEALDIAGINIGTTGVEGAWTAPSSHTTPDALTLHAMLAAAAAAGVTHAAMEASSHGIEQRRMDGVRLKAAAFTNLTQDHLDYHKTMDAYFDAKVALFDRLLPDDGVAVVNLNGARSDEILARCAARGLQTLTIGPAESRADFRILSQRFDATGQDLRFDWQGKTQLVRLNLVGGFQAENVAVAAGLVIACGAPAEAVFAVLPRLSGVRGRMELAATRQNGAAVYVDFAHTPDALETALKALRPHVMGHIHVVFGAGGDRDTTKRPLMGKAALTYADKLIVTDDNPRSEDPASIRAAIMQACPQAQNVGDRAEAILRGVAGLEAGDALLVAGKGHESGQTIAGHVYPFDDVEQASVAVAALDGMI